MSKSNECVIIMLRPIKQFFNIIIHTIRFGLTKQSFYYYKSTIYSLCINIIVLNWTYIYNVMISDIEHIFIYYDLIKLFNRYDWIILASDCDFSSLDFDTEIILATLIPERP